MHNRLTCFGAFWVLLAAVPQARAAEGGEQPIPIVVPAPYSAPFLLRGIMPSNALRLDSTVATSSTQAGASTSVVEFLSASARVGEHWAVNARLGWLDLARSPTVTGSALTNLALGGIYAGALRDLRFSVSGGLVLPIASGGGDAPDAGAKSAIGSGALSRGGMDNALFGPNDLSLTVGGDLAYVANGVIAQLEGTLIQAFRVRGANTQPDSTKTNSTYGLAVGYFVLPQLTAMTELRYQRFLSTPAAVAADSTGALRDSLSVAVGARLHFSLRGLKLHPGASVAWGIDDPLAARGFHLVQLDLLMNL